jgi:plastocyanin
MSTTFRAMIVAAALGAAAAPLLAAVAPTPQAQNAPTAVSIDNFTFTPQTLTVKAGTTVTWANKDDIPHGIAWMKNASPSPRRSTPTTPTRSHSPPRAVTSISATSTRT